MIPSLDRLNCDDFEISETHVEIISCPQYLDRKSLARSCSQNCLKENIQGQYFLMYEDGTKKARKAKYDLLIKIKVL